MLIDNTFELGIPTHIKFTLFKYDYFDSIIINRVKKECKNYSKISGEYCIKKSSFLNAIKTSKRLNKEIIKSSDFGYVPSPSLKPNSILFSSFIKMAGVKKFASRETKFSIKFLIT